MLATSGAAVGQPAVPSGREWVHEIKWDGVRLLAEVHRGELVLRTRSGRVVTDAFPELRGLTALAQDAMLDGEAVALSDGEPSFAHVVSRVHLESGPRGRRTAQELSRDHPATFVAFDLLRLEGLDLTALSWTHRRAALEDVWVAGPGRTLSPTHEEGSALWAGTRARGLEGVVSKRRSSTYQPGARSQDWLKYPHRETQSLVVGGWRPEVGSTRLGALLVGTPSASDPERLVYRGRVGSGLAGRAGAALARAIEDCPTGPCPFSPDVPPIDARGTTWLLPRMVVEVRSLGETAAGRLRQPSFDRWRADLSVQEVGRARG
jgi:bifunctional non-homologous end joining protein LigD